MIEGLAIWALFIYLLRLVGMPWNKFTQAFSYLGGVAWLLFVWVGLINFTPMDMSGGSVVQSPHIQVRPDSPNVKGKVEEIFIQPNQSVVKGQPMYRIDATQYDIALQQASTALATAESAIRVANEEVSIAESTHATRLQDIVTLRAKLANAKTNLAHETKMLARFKKQNTVVKNTITESDIDKQSTAVANAKHQVATLESQLESARLEADKAQLAVSRSKTLVESKIAEFGSAEQKLAKAQWELDSTLVNAPADGFVTNFILREGQRVSMVPRLQMYTEEKYVLMRVNHQAIRNVKEGQTAEFASSVYPGKIFSSQVEGIVEATGEAQSNLLGIDQSVRSTTGKNLQNKHHFVRLKINEPEGYDIPVGSVGLAWVSGEKPVGFLSFLDVIRGIIIRMKSQLYFFYSI
ncbi:HlyD family secretion protein [Vibrio sonorensis]|uniref:HlyD family secretion protein n=1 Tax=Vibrio sonorensis TaxID=1004316 RepID=UPI0008DB1C6E|nr:biotin/lipoyl-binding protein [Vibrio sonorensis]